MIVSYMADHDTRFLQGVTPRSIERDPTSGRIKVAFQTADGLVTEDFDTVLAAIGKKHVFVITRVIMSNIAQACNVT